MKADFYLDFENNFRGLRDQTRNIFSNYFGLIQYIIEIDEEPALQYIDCGRGEWLTKCSDHRIKCCGIELNNLISYQN